METQTFSDDIRRYLWLALKWAWLLILATLLGGGAAYFITGRATPVYESSTLVLINEAPITKSVDITTLQTSERLAKTYVQVMTTRPVLEGVIARLGLDMAVEDLQDAARVEVVRETQLLRVTVEHTDPQLAADIANAMVLEFSEQNQAEQASRYAASKQNLEGQLAQLDLQIKAASEMLDGLGAGASFQAERDRLEATLSQYQATYTGLLQKYEDVRMTEAQSTATVAQKEAAIASEFPVRPRVLLSTFLAAIIGLLLAAGVAVLIEALDDTLKGPAEVTEKLGLPVLGIVAHHPAAEGGLIAHTEPMHPVAESFRSLRTNIQFASVDKPLRTLLVTSPSPEDGKSTLAANLATVMAQSGRQVVLIDADLRRPRLHRLLNVPNRVGLSRLFVEPEVRLDGSIHPTHTEKLAMISSGGLPPNPSELLSSDKMVEILNVVLEQADLVVIDSPPLAAVTDAMALAPRVDGVLLVVKPGMTRLAMVRHSMEQLQHVGARVLGVVLNDVEFKHSRYYYAYYYRGYHDSQYYGYGHAAHKSRRKAARLNSSNKHRAPE